MTTTTDYFKRLVANSLAYVSVEPVKERRFGYRVTFDLTVRNVSGQVTTQVSFPHGKRERSPHLDEIVAKARLNVISDLSAFGKAS